MGETLNLAIACNLRARAIQLCSTFPRLGGSTKPFSSGVILRSSDLVPGM